MPKNTKPHTEDGKAEERTTEREPDGPAAQLAAQHGLSIEDVKAGARRLLPIVEPIAKLTPNKYDDAFVAFVKGLLDASA